MQQPTRQQIVQDTLRARALENRGTLPPRHLAQLGAVLADLLTGQRDDTEAQATQFAERGLALAGVMAAGAALQQALIADGDYEHLPQVAERLAAVTSAMNRAEVARCVTSRSNCARRSRVRSRIDRRRPSV